MYKLEDRILFDGAAVADVADAQQEADSQQEAAQAAEAEEAAQQEAADSADSAESGDSDGSESSEPGSLEEVLAAVNAGSLGADDQRVDVLLVSDSLENADDICNTASNNTIVVRYDARTASAADLLQQITDALDGNVADSIGFATESGENAHVQLFADTDTSLDTVHDSVHQNFFNGLDALLDEGARVNLFASNLASTAEGTALVDAIGDALDHDVAASIDETGSEAAGGDWNLEYGTNGSETDAADVYLDENLIDNFTSLLEDDVNHEVAFINSSVMGDDSIVAVLEYRGVEIVHIDNAKGISQITDYLAQHSDVDGIHIITHGNDGYFLVGSDNINNESLSAYYADTVAAWSDSLTADADIMIYGCNLAESGEGMNLIDTIANLTGADVAASNDDTGSRGDWELEYTSGDIETAALAVHDYQYTLDNHLVNSLLDEPVTTLPDGVTTLRKAIVDSVAGDSITFAPYTTLGGDTVTLSSAADLQGYGQLEITTQISIDGTIAITGGYLRAVVTNDGTVGPEENFRLLYVADTAGSSETPVDIYNMIFTSGEAEIIEGDYVGEGNGGSIYSAGSLQLRDVDVKESTAAIDGGGIYVASTGYLKVVNDTGGKYASSISSNTAATSGGGIFNNSGTVEIVGAASHAVSIIDNTVTGSGGGIYSLGDITATYTDIYSNEAGGDGGGVYISGGISLSSFSNSSVYLNSAGGDGGGIYFFQGQDLTLNSSFVGYNTADGDGGGMYINESRYLRNISSSISGNTAVGDGGGVYVIESGNFYHQLGYIDDNTAGGSGGAVYMTNSGYGVVDGYLADLYLTAMDISGNTTTAGNGTVYYDGIRKTGDAGSVIAYMTAIDSNIVNNGGGGAVYQLAGDLTVWSSTLAFNTAATTGGSIYFTGDNLDVQFATLAYNEASDVGGADIYFLSEASDTLTVVNSIIYDNDSTPETQIVIAGVTPGIYRFDSNIYTNYDQDVLTTSDIETIVTAGSDNIIGSASAVIPDNLVVARQEIIDNLYLDTAMRNYYNYHSRVLPLLVDYNQAISEGTFGWRNIAWQSGTTDYNTSIEYDARGNTREGYQFNESTHEYEQNSTPSIGAFEPIYEIVVTSKDGGGMYTYFDDAILNGITLREAVRWMDSYDAISYANDTSNYGALYNSDRYIKFDSVEFAADSVNTITLTSDIDIDKSVIIGMTPWLNDQLDTYKTTYAANDISVDDMNAWGGFRAQDSTGRITVSGSNSTNIFSVYESNSTEGDRKVYINNLTVTEGYASYTTNGGRGGGIYNTTNLYLSNVAVTNSTATNTSGSYYSNSGWGGGIYNTENLTLVESTISGNTAIGNSSSTNGVSKAGLGGGIYNDNNGSLSIYSSSIHDNTAKGSTYVSNEGAMGGGIYFDGGTNDLLIANTTISGNTNNAEYSGAGDLHGQGSAVYLESGDLYMYYNTVVLNTSVRNVEEVETGISAAITSRYNYTTETSQYFDLMNNIIANNDYSFTGNPKTRDFFDLYILVDDPEVTPDNVRVAFNIIGYTTGLTIKEDAGTLNNQYNIIGDPVYGMIANLNLEDTLNYNGGKTKSYKILDNSVAYQKGILLSGISAFEIDQRGADRDYAGANTTIGSYQPLEYIVVTSTSDTNSASDVGFDFASNSGGWMKTDLQLREAFALADIHTKVIMSTSIEVTDPTVTLSPDPGFGELVADIGFTMDGQSYDSTREYSLAAAAWTWVSVAAPDTAITPLVIDANNASRVIRVSDNTPNNINLTLSYATLKNGNSDSRGGAIYNFENLTLDHISVLDSTAALQGGGIYSQVGDLTITDSIIQGNTSSSNGGGLYYESNSLNIENTSFLENTGTGSGGGFYAIGAQVFMDGSTVGDNTSGAHGGGIFTDSSDFFTINSTIANNSADENGGGMVFNGGGYLRMGYVTVANNISGADINSVNNKGGGFYQTAGTLEIYNSIIAQNYQTSIADANLNDIYLGTAVSLNPAQVINNVLGVYTGTPTSSISTANNRVYDSNTGLYGLDQTPQYVLNIDTVLYDNGGDTKTIYVGDLDTATINYGIDLYYNYTAATNKYSFSTTTGTQITTDQRGESRTSGSITVGAYQKNIGDYDYVFDNDSGDGDYNNHSNWTLNGSRLISASQLDFNTSDARFNIAADLDMSNGADDWTINWRSQLIVDDGVTLAIAANDALNARVYVRGTMSVADTGALQVRGNSKVDDSDAGTLTVNGTISTVDTTLNGASHLELLDQAEFTLATLGYTLASMNLVNSSTATSVTYSYDSGTQQIIDVKDNTGASTSYGHLTLNGASLKTTSTNLSVQTLTLSGTASSLDVSGSLTIADATGGGSVENSLIYLTGNLTLGTGAPTSFDNVDFTFDGDSAQQISLAGNTTFNSIEVDNSAGVSVDSNTLTLTDFTFTDGAFELQNTSSLYIADDGSVTGADGDLGHYFITTGTGTVSLEIDAALGTNFILAIEDGTSGTYKWVDTLIESPATRAAIRITDGISPAISSDAGSITVTWDIDTSSAEFTLTLSDYSDTAAGQYFDPTIGTLHWNDAGTWDDVGWTTDKNGSFYIGHGYSEVWLNADNVLTDGTLRYALAQLEILDEDGVIVFNADHVDSDFYDSISGDYLDADIVLGSVLQIVDGLNISIFGLDNGKASYIIGEDGVQVMIVGTGGATSETINLKNLDFRGNGDYVLVNNEDLTLTNVSVAGYADGDKWTTGTINNTNGTIAVYDNSYLKLDGSADGTAFTYNPGSTLQYMLTPGAASSALTIDDDSAEFGTSIQGLTVDTGVALTLSDRSSAYDVNGDTNVSGSLILANDETLSLGGASNELGTFSAGTGSTVVYDRAGVQTVDAVNYVNLTISGGGDNTKTAIDSFNITGSLTVAADTELAFDFDEVETVTVAGDTAVDGTLTFSGAGAGALGLYGTNNDLGTFTYHTSTVSYLGATGQELSDVDYYNLIVGGGTVGTAVVKETVDFDFNVYNDMTIAAYTTFGLDANIVLVEGDFTMSTLGAFVFADDGFLKLKGETNAAFNFDDGFGTVIYQGGDSQLVAEGTYHNLQIANGIKSLGADVTVINDFEFAGDAGIFQLGTYDLYLDGSITGASETSYFASNIASTATDQGKVFLRLAVDEVQNLVIGTASNWSELTFTGGNTQQYVSIWAYDGVTTNGQPGGTEIAHPENAVNMTFNVAPQSAGSYSMDFVDASASAKGADFNPSLVATYYYSGTSGSWTQVGNPLTQSGPFFFGTGVPYGGLVVTNTNNTGSGSLRWAIAAANILDGINLITFSKDVFYTQKTITLTSGEMAITDHVVIQGLGATLTTVSGNDGSRIFNINSGISVSVSGLTLTGGYSTGNGGAIYLAGSLQLENVEIKDSSSAGLGEAIYVADTGALYTMRSTISSSGNTATIHSYGTISMFNSTVVELDNQGAIYFGGGENLLFNVTVSGHIYVYDDPATPEIETTLALNNSLVYGTVTGDGTVTSNNSIVSTSSSYFVNGNLEDNGGWVRTIAIKDFTWEDTLSDAADWTSGETNQYETADTLSSSPQTVEITYNGETYTLTEVKTTEKLVNNTWYLDISTQKMTVYFEAADLTSDSSNTVLTAKAIDAGMGYADGAYRYDARGYLVNGSNDIGAYEYDGYMAWNANTSAYYSSLDSALGAASSADTIELISSRILLDSEITVSSDVTIRGAGTWDSVLSAGVKGAGSDRLFTIGDTNSAPAVHMLDLAIRGGNVSGNGGAIYNYGSLHLHNVMIADNAASGNGGAIYNSADAFVYGERSSIRMNTAENGAGIYNLGSLTLNHSRLANNTASVSGGGIYNGVYGEQKGQLFLLNSTVDHNTASSGDGGGIYSTGTFQAEYSTIYGNSAAADGGGIYNIGDSRLINLTIASNYAADDGGGIYAATGAVNLVNSIIAYNTDVSGWDDISDTGSVITQLSNFVGTDNSGLYTASNSLFSSSLADNGGWTYTLALNSESGYYYRVVGQGVEVGINYDQRGYMINNLRDLGAYEANGYIGYYLLSDNYRSYFSSIATALQAQSDKATRTLYLLGTRIKEADINADLRYYNSADKKYLPQTVTIKGAASGETVISAGGTGRIFYTNATIDKGGELILDRLTLADGTHIKALSPLTDPRATDGYGGTIYNNGANLTLNNVNIINSISSNDGGAIYNGMAANVPTGDKTEDVYGVLTVSNSYFGDNFAGKNGGAISGLGSAGITVSTFYGNIAGVGGGGIAITGEKDVTLSNSTVAYNRAFKGLGGGISLTSAEGAATFTSGKNLLVRNYNGLSFERDGDLSTVDFGHGSGAPTTTGNAGDLYLNADNSDWYTYNGIEWVLEYNVETRYPATVIVGDDAPSDDDDGTNGNYYVLNDDSGRVYRKDGGKWGYSADLALDTPLYALGNTVLSGEEDPLGSTGATGEYYVNTTTGILFKKNAEADWDEQYDMNGDPEMHTGSGAPPTDLIPYTAGDYYTDTDTGSLYILSVLKGGEKGTWSGIIATLKSSDTISVGMDYYFSAGKFKDDTYNLVEYQNGTWTEDTKTFFGEITYEEKEPTKVKTDMHDILGPKEKIFVQGVVADDNGGWTNTLALAGDGAATDAGTGSGTDQRGYDTNGTRDIGAYEYRGFVATVNELGYDSIQNAINAAGADGTVTINATRVLENNIMPQNSVTLAGTAGESYISGGYSGRVLEIEASGTTLTINNLMIGEGVALDSTASSGAGAVGNGGTIFSSGALTMTDAQMYNSFAERSGGAIYSVGDTTVNSTGNVNFPTLFADNRANVSGGAISSSGTLTIKGSEYKGSSYKNRHTLVQFIDNSSSGSGGAISAGGNVGMQYFYMAHNHAMNGGALSLSGTGDAKLEDFDIEYNFASSQGGAVYAATYGNLEIRDNEDSDTNYATYISSNRALNDGGAVYFTNSGNLFLGGVEHNGMTGVRINSNAAGNDGGGIYVSNSGDLTLDYYVRATSNTAGNDGGGIYFADSGEFSMFFANSVSSNTAANDGGGIYINNATSVSTSNHATISNNSATSGSGGGIYIASVPTISIDYTEAGGNRAGVNGGFMYIANTAGDTPATGNASISITDLDAYNNSTDRTDLTVTSIAISGDWAFIGVADPDTSVSTDPGQVSVYKLTAGGAWEPHQVLEGVAANDYFGNAVSVDGTSALIGAKYTNGLSGAAYIYDYNATSGEWEQSTVLTAPGNDIYFGYSVSISGDQALVGSPYTTKDSEMVGAAYLYTSGTLTDTFYGETSSSYFGYSVAINGDQILVGSPYWENASDEHVGAAYFYTNDGSDWNLTETFTGKSDFSYFGNSVAIFGDKAVIGAQYENSFYGEVTFYNYNGSDWALKQTITAGFEQYRLGESVAISGDKAVLGTPYGDSWRGAAYMYEYTGSSWNLEQTISGSSDGFGNLVAIDGDNAMVNSRDGSNVKLYGDNGTWQLAQTVNMFTAEGKGGAVYIENGNDAVITINRSGFDGNAAGQGSGVWIDHGSNITITNSTFGSNAGGSALYLGYGNLSINFATFAHNTSTNTASPVTIELDASQASEFSLTNSIIYDDAASTISLGSLTTVKASSRNLFLNATSFSGPSLYNSNYRTITAYDTAVSASVLDSNNNIVGYDTTTTNFISNYSYMASSMAYHANYRTRAIALNSEDSLAYRYILNGSTVRPGNNSAGLTTDQRGNSRTGYTYNTTTGKYELNSAPSIGAFEPMFYLTVNNKGDMTYDPFGTIITSGLAANAWFADAIADDVTVGDGSLNLREASYWIDSFNPNTDQFNANRYVKFDANVFTADGDNTISLNANAGPIEIYTSQIISMIPGYNDQSFVADNVFWAQDDSARITVDAGNNDMRVFTIRDTKNPNINVGINNLNITGGATTNNTKDYGFGRGGGIYNNANLTLNNVVVTGNSAANAPNSSNFGLGGGIYNSSSGTLTINDSTISNNTVTGTKINTSTDNVGLGGGIYNNGGSVTVNRSLISGNTANGFTVDPAKDTTTLAGIGGGIFSTGGSMTLNNSTITANTLGASSRNTGSAIYVKDGNLTASHNTIVNNSLPTASLGSSYSTTAGAVFIKGTGNATLTDNIFANNNANGTAGFRGRDIYTASTVSVTENNNIVGYYTGSHNFSTGTGNIIGDGFGNVANLNLDSTLRYNGGKTMNFRVLSNSVATSAGTTVSGSTDYDQRGYQRADGTSSTIGSYEMTTAITLITNAETTIDYSNPSIGFDFTNNRPGWEMSLRNAAYLADDNSTITINPSDDTDVWTRTAGVLDPISVKNEAIRIINGVSIVTYNDQIIKIDGGWSGGTATDGVRLFWINSAAAGLVDVSMTNLILQNANALTDTSNSNGGAVYNAENLTLNNVQVISSQAQNGGGIYSTEGTLTLAEGTIIDGNKATDGGGVYVDAGNFTMTGKLDGGTYEFVKVSNNTAAGSGGGLYAMHATVNTTLGDVSSNTAATHGGGLYLVNSALTMLQSQIMSNTADYDAGGMYMNGGTATITTSTFGENTAKRYGGGLRISAQSFKMVNSTIANNTSGAYAGGVYFTGSGSYNLTFVTIANNISGTAKNATETAGGGVFIAGGNLTMTNTVIANNYHVSAADANRDEFYTTSLNWIASATYNAIGTSSVAGTLLDFHAVDSSNISNTSYTDFYSDIRIDSGLYNNGGATKTLYVMQNSLLVGNGIYLADVTTSQNAKVRLDPPTIGAYESSSVTYYYISGDVNKVTSWNTDPDTPPTGTNPDFNAADNLYIFDDEGIAADFSTGTWSISNRSLVTVEALASFTISGNAVVKSFVHKTPAVNANMTITVEDTGTLIFNTGTAQLVNLSTLGTTSDVNYIFDGNQTVYTATYGNLTISGSGTKTTTESITVSNNLTLSNAAATLQTTGSLSVTGTTSGTGNIVSTVNAAFTGDVTLTGNISAAAGTIDFASTADLTDSTVTAATITIDGILTVDTSNITATTALNVNNNVIAEGGDTSILSSTGFNFVETKSITVNDADTQLTFNVGAQNVNYYGLNGIPGTDFNIDVRTVTIDDPDGRFEVSTTGNISINNISGTDDENVDGTLVFTGDVISVAGGVDFNTAGIELNNSSNMNIGGQFEVEQNLIITGPVTLTADATLTSVTGDLGLTGTVTGATHDLTMEGDEVTTGIFNNLGDLTIDANTVEISKNISATGIDVSGNATLSVSPTLTSSGDLAFNDELLVDSGANAKLLGDTLTLDGDVTGAGNLTLEATGDDDNELQLIDMTGNLSMTAGSFNANEDISSANLSISSPATLTMDSQDLTATGNLTNAGELDSDGTVTVGGNITNSGTKFTADTVNASGNITNTGSMTIDSELYLEDTSKTSTLSLSAADLSAATLSIAADKQVSLTGSALEVADFAFSADATPTSKFILASGTSLDVTGTLDYHLELIVDPDNLYTGNYFVTSGGGQLVRTMNNGTPVEYRVGNSTSATVITLSVLNDTEKIAVGVIDSIIIRNEVVTGIQDTTRFTTNIDRNWNGTTGDGTITVTMDWDNDLNGSGFVAGNAALFSSEGWNWTNLGSTVVVEGSERSTTGFDLPHNGTYAIANIGAQMTGTFLNGNVALYEMANAHFSTMHEALDSNIFFDFAIGIYPYYSSDMWVNPYNLMSVGKSIYNQMEYRLVTNPLTNILGGQVPPVGSVVGQAITEGASLTLTSDAPVYLEVNGEYSVGAGWMPLSVPASAENIEQYQAPITQGQIDQFYIDFGGREGVFEKPVSFKSDLDEMLDDLLAG